MSRRSQATVITPEIKKVIEKWEKYAKDNNLVFSPWTDIPFKAKVNVEYDGACVCKRYERSMCPCKECMQEVKTEGQ